MSDIWLNSFQVAHKLGLRESASKRDPRIDPIEDVQIMNAFCKRIERGTLPPPDARLRTGEMRWWQSTIDAWMEAHRVPPGHRLGRRSKKAAEVANG